MQWDTASGFPLGLVSLLGSPELYSLLRAFLYAGEEVIVISSSTGLYRTLGSHRKDILAMLSLWILLEIDRQWQEEQELQLARMWEQETHWMDVDSEAESANS